MSNKEPDTCKEAYKDNIEMVLLKTISDGMQLNIIKDLLDKNNVPYILQDRGIGGYMKIYSGFSIYGTDILVEKSMFEKAKSIIDEFPWSE